MWADVKYHNDQLEASQQNIVTYAPSLVPGPPRAYPEWNGSRIGLLCTIHPTESQAKNEVACLHGDQLDVSGECPVRGLLCNNWFCSLATGQLYNLGLWCSRAPLPDNHPGRGVLDTKLLSWPPTIFRNSVTSSQVNINCGIATRWLQRVVPLII